MRFGAMKPHRRSRLFTVLFLVASASGAAAFALLALDENLDLFYSPAQIAAGEAPRGETIRAGGMVLDGSVVRDGTGLGVSFVIGDLQGAEVRVAYTGILPDLFREGQGVVVRGRLGSGGAFAAEEVLAKHDENYMPPELADILPEKHAGAGR